VGRRPEVASVHGGTQVKIGKSPWVIMDKEHFAYCEHCGGAEEPPEMGITIAAFVKYIDYILEKHKNCKGTHK
jgi:hypothetical protein